MPYHPRGKKWFLPSEKWQPYERTRYKSTAWRQGAKAHIKKVYTQYKERFTTPRFMLKNVQKVQREIRANRNTWAKHYHKFKHVKQATHPKALAAQSDWRWRNRDNYRIHSILRNKGIIKRI